MNRKPTAQTTKLAKGACKADVRRDDPTVTEG